MNREKFEQEILCCLKKQLLVHPAMMQEDAVKFVFQAMLGVGHLLTDRNAVTDFILRETDGLEPDPAEPLTEKLSSSWCRINLRRAMAEHLPPSVIAGLMLNSHVNIRFSRKDVYDFCSGPIRAEVPCIADTEWLKRILDESWLPSHSSVYRVQVRPAYRVISAAWIPCMEAIRKIAEKTADPGRLLITLDGPCAGGKTTLAGKLANVFEAAQVHTDDFVIPHAQKTKERLAVPGGNCDWERLIREVIAPWKLGRPVLYRKYDCRNDRLMPEETLPDCRMLILEGSYCNLPGIREQADLRLFADTPEKERMERLRQRESPESLEQFRERWIPLENAYFDAYGLPDRNCLTISSA